MNLISLFLANVWDRFQQWRQRHEVHVSFFHREWVAAGRPKGKAGHDNPKLSPTSDSQATFSGRAKG